MSFFFVYFQKQGGRLRESVKRKERREEAKVRQEKWLSEEKIEETEFYQSTSYCYIYAGILLLNDLYFSGDLMQNENKMRDKITR